MYLRFYGLSEPPFRGTPDPRFLYLSARHRDAMAQLEWGVREGAGFMMLTGEVGTGKTTLLHSLLRQLDPRTAASYVFNPTLSFDDLLEYVLTDFSIPAAPASRAPRLGVLNTFLLERHRAGLNTVLVLDEAQLLTVEMLERLRLLSNFETATAKLLQIILAGQPELATKLELRELRQLRQRIVLHVTLAPLSTDETREYIRTRLRTAGARDLGIFSEPAVREVARRTEGFPRLVNILGDHSLLVGYADQKRRVDAATVREASRYRPHVVARARVPARWSAATLATVIVASCAAAVLGAHASGFLNLADWVRRVALP
jgi:general secretion pathway protein A